MGQTIVTSISPAIEHAIKSDPGRDPDKQVNEDACGYRATRLGHLAVVCDGMGGHAGGREAAQLALQTIFDAFDAAPDGASARQVLHDAIAEANRRVHAMSLDEARKAARPGSTVVAILAHATGTEVAHVGDSRCYLVHHAQIFQLTKDHSMVQQLVDAGLLTPAQAAVHPNANQITRALGMAGEVDVEVRLQPIAHVAGDAFVLCSDGLSDLVDAPEILQIVGSEPPAQAAGKLVDLANARGGHDNITVVVVRTKESADAHAAPVQPTVAQTRATQAVAPTAFDDRPSGRITEPGGMPAAQAMVPQAQGSDRAIAPSPSQPVIVPAAPPRSARTTEHEQRRKRWIAVTVAVIALAAVAIVAVVVIVVGHVSERAGKRKAWPVSHDLSVGDEAGAQTPDAGANGNGPSP